MDDLGVPLFLETSISGKHLELQGQPVVGVSHKFFRGRVYSHQNLPWDCFLAEVFFFSRWFRGHFCWVCRFIRPGRPMLSIELIKAQVRFFLGIYTVYVRLTLFELYLPWIFTLYKDLPALVIIVSVASKTPLVSFLKCIQNPSFENPCGHRGRRLPFPTF